MCDGSCISRSSQPRKGNKLNSLTAIKRMNTFRLEERHPPNHKEDLRRIPVRVFNSAFECERYVYRAIISNPSWEEHIEVR